MQDYYVYILYSHCDKYYVGHTESLERRLEEHNQGKGGDFSSNCIPWSLVYQEVLSSRSEAMKREKEIKKKKSRKYIEWLLTSSR